MKYIRLGYRNFRTRRKRETADARFWIFGLGLEKKGLELRKAETSSQEIFSRFRKIGTGLEKIDSRIGKPILGSEGLDWI